MMNDENKTILRGEANPADVALTPRASKRSHLTDPLAVARDGVEALNFPFARGAHAGGVGTYLPTLVVVDLKLPKLDDLGVLKSLRADTRTAPLPTAILTSSKAEQDVLSAYSFGANRYVRKPVDFVEFVSAVKVLGQYWRARKQIPRRRTP